MSFGRRIPSPEALRREDALALFRAGLEAVAPEPLVLRETLRLLDEAPRGRIVLIGGGKATARMLAGAWQGFSRAWSGGWRGWVEGVVSVPDAAGPAVEGPWGRVELLQGGHPLPDEGSERAGRRMLALAEDAGADDLLLVLLSGGASALLGVPAQDISLTDLRESTRLLLAGGLPIQEINAVRSHLSATAGGSLAKAAAPARSVCLVISDVVGDDLAAIGSGPLYGDPTTFADCLAILERSELALPTPARARLEAGARGLVAETVKPGGPGLGSVEHRVVANNLAACRAMATEAERRGYRSLILSDRLEGEARHLGRFLSAFGWSAAQARVPLSPPCALISGGEAAVRVCGRGMGGRNQETVLSSVPLLAGLPVTFLSAGSDGIDGPTAAAGGVVDGSSEERARGLGLDARRALEENDSGDFLARLGDQVVTGPTGTNVADLRALLVSAAEPSDLRGTK